MKKNEVLKALDNISEMNDDDIKIDRNADYIRKTAIEAYSLIKTLEREILKRRNK